jgi:hypothetical protein
MLLERKCLRIIIKGRITNQKNNMSKLEDLAVDLGLTKVRTYGIYIKSHCEAPDLEEQVEARSKDEAIELLMKQLGKWGWEEDIIAEHVYLIE